MGQLKRLPETWGRQGARRRVPCGLHGRLGGEPDGDTTSSEPWTRGRCLKTGRSRVLDANRPLLRPSNSPLPPATVDMKFALSSVVAVLVAAELGCAQATYACPGDNDKTMVAYVWRASPLSTGSTPIHEHPADASHRGDNKYKLKCGVGILGMPIEQKPCGSLAECASRCAANAQCLHSTFVDGDCALKKAGNEFQLSELASWIFVEKVPAGQTPPQQQNDQQKPLTGDPTSFACPKDEKKRYST